MYDISAPATVNQMIGMMPGAVAVSFRGVTGSGHMGAPPGVFFDAPDLIAGQPSVVVAACYFPDIGVDEVQGLQHVEGSNIMVGNYQYRISRAVLVWWQSAASIPDQLSNGVW